MTYRYDVTVTFGDGSRRTVVTRAPSPQKACAQVQYRLISEGYFPVSFEWAEYPF